MPRVSKIEKSPDASDVSPPAFEDALAQLEEMVEEMESDQIPLEDLIRKYEEGTRLYRLCEKRLDEAQGRIEIIRKNRNGETVLEPFGEAATDSADAITTRSGDTQTNGELF
ncbi:MAG: exodeoxyribonuclease VII small subunit [Verrucomicrobiales bacterium]|jgi:exodeoxyribonuclease VII small subunit|nr:exodeoxyribonuclease VII small subunit [Verrucomicrobiales bacterium]MDP4790606.1 exodeoxyribonuclease VII small subunit [Verrucomicrobiales bacterium]MDP4938784.1 exodeoxyribonuclease VII small subunit [Verrucomicrobiales bacterium]MDP5005957.1 exodeoxyribonuclease VII small subunit [Verrucomicrobiales bacterium]